MEKSRHIARFPWRPCVALLSGSDSEMSITVGFGTVRVIGLLAVIAGVGFESAHSENMMARAGRVC
jgi:hypothetical protein